MKAGEDSSIHHLKGLCLPWSADSALLDAVLFIFLLEMEIGDSLLTLIIGPHCSFDSFIRSNNEVFISNLASSLSVINGYFPDMYSSTSFRRVSKRWFLPILCKETDDGKWFESGMIGKELCYVLSMTTTNSKCSSAIPINKSLAWACYNLFVIIASWVSNGVAVSKPDPGWQIQLTPQIYT